MSFYKYKEQGESTQVDFSKLGDAFAAKAKTLNTNRAEQKAELEKNYQDFKKQTEENAPLGNHKGANEAMAAFTEDAAQKALDMQRRMRNGDIPVSARNAYMTNLKSTTTQMFELGNSFNENREELMARHEGDGAVGSAEELAYLEAAELFNGKGEPFIGDDGTVFLGARVNGKIDMDNPVSLAQAKAMATQRVDKFDLTTKSATAAKALDQPYVLAVQSGKIKTIEDARNNPDFDAALDAMVEADLSDPSKLMSVLTDGGAKLDVGMGVMRDYEYSLTNWDGMGDSPNFIASEYDEETGQYTPDLTKAQEDAAKDKYKTMILAQIGRKETAKAIIPQQKWQADAANERKKLQGNVTMAAKLYSGTAAEIQAAREYFVGLNKNIKGITRTTDGVVVTYLEKDGSTVSNTISFMDADGVPKSEGDFVRSITELTGDGDMDRAIKRANLNGTAPTEHSSIEGANRTQVISKDPDAEYGTLELNITGQENLVTVEAAFDDVNIEGEVMRGNEGDRQVAADGFSEVIEEVMSNLTQGKNKGLVAQKTDSASNLFEIDLPGTLTAPIFLPIVEGDAMMKSSMSNITKALYEAANLGESLSPNDLKDFIPAATFNKMQEIYESQNIPADEWNGGDGVQDSDGGSSETEVDNTSSRFNSTPTT